MKALKQCSVIALIAMLTPQYASLAAVQEGHVLNKGQFSKIFCDKMGIKDYKIHSFFEDVPDSDPYSKYIASMNFGFPDAEWNGKQWQARPQQSLTSSMVVRAFVIFKSFPLVDAVSADEIIVREFPNYYSYGYVDKDKIYFATVLKLGGKSEVFGKNRMVNQSEAENILDSLIQSTKNYKSDTISGSKPSIFSNRKVDYVQQYYQDGPIENQFAVKTKVLDDNYYHQYTSVYGGVEMNTRNTSYGIGIWGDATSFVADAKMVGGFFTVTGTGAGVDSQLVGQEIDVINKAEPGQVHNKSSVGVQIVAIGRSPSTSAIEIISDNVSTWDHGVVLEEGSISKNGTVIGMGQTSPVKFGIDFGNTPFSDAAIRLKTGGKIKFESLDYKHASAIFLDEAGFLNIASGPNGFVLKANDWFTNYLVITNDGKILVDNATLVLKSPSGTKFAISVDDNGNLKTTKVN